MDKSSVEREHREREERRGRARMLARLLVGSCADCGVGSEEAELYPVPEDHLTFFGRDELCEDCAYNHGVL